MVWLTGSLIPGDLSIEIETCLNYSYYTSDISYHMKLTRSVQKREAQGSGFPAKWEDSLC